MNFWQYLLAAFGGNAALLFLLGWLAKSFGSQLLTKDLARFKATLAHDAKTENEHLRHSLQTSALEHQIRFSKLYERRAKVVAKVYGLFVDAERAAANVTSSAVPTDDNSRKQRYIVASNKMAELYNYFDKNRIYLPIDFCQIFDSFAQKMNSELLGFGMFTNHDDASLRPEGIKVKYDAFVRLLDFLDEEQPKIRASLEVEFRSIIGAS